MKDDTLTEKKYDLARDAHLTALREGEKLITKLEEEKPKLWAAIYGNLSNESMDRVKSESEGWKKAYGSEDALTLWLLIQRINLTSAMRAVTLRSLDGFAGLKMCSEESATELTERFDVVLTNFDSVQAEIPSQPYLVTQFLRKLGMGHFASLSADSRMTKALNYKTRITDTPRCLFICHKLHCGHVHQHCYASCRVYNSTHEKQS